MVCSPRLAVRLLPSALLIVFWAGVARADDVADFYRGHTLNLIAGFNVGGGADAYARLVARYLGQHLPGNPTVVVRNMPGAGSMTAANHLFNVSPRDGSEIGLFAGNIAIDPVIGGVPAKYDARKFAWLGAPSSQVNVCVAAKRTSFKTFDDVLQREMVTGTAGTSAYDFPVVLANVLGAKLKLIKGYNGSAALRLALERGEIEGFCGVSLTSIRSGGLTDDKVNILLQIALTKSRDLPDTPFVMDYAQSAADRSVLRLIFGWLDFERPIGAPPDTPAPRVAALRNAFDAAIKDPALLADAAQSSLSIEPMTGKAIASFVDEVYLTPPDIAARAAQLLGRATP